MIPLEDSFNDILGKAQRGLKLSSEVIAREAATAVADYERVRDGQFDEALVRKVAPLFKLGADRLVAIGKGEWHPGTSHPANLDRVTTAFHGGTVNAYVIWDPASKEAAFFDTGMDAGPLLQIVRDRQLVPKYLFLTHTHQDHIAELPNLTRGLGIPAYVHKSEDIGGVQTFEWGATFPLGALQIETRQTTGHAEGGTTYIIRGLEVPIAVVGDALFAGSMGGGMVSYQDALETNRRSLFTLPDQTVVAPGHGPLTTIGTEKHHNPFFPEYQASPAS